MRIRISFALMMIASCSCLGQEGASLLRALKSTTEDSTRFLLCYKLSEFYEEWKVDSSLHYAEKATEIAKLNNKKLAEAAALNSVGYQYLSLGKFGESFKTLRRAHGILEDPDIERDAWYKSTMKNRLLELSYNHYILGILMLVTQNPRQELYHYKEALRIAGEAGDSIVMRPVFSNMAYAYMDLYHPDSALLAAQRAISITPPENKKFICWQYQSLGWVYYKMNNPDLALPIFHKGLRHAKEEDNQGCILYISSDMARHFLIEQNQDSSLYYAKMALASFDHLGDMSYLEYNISSAYDLVYLSYKLRNQGDSTFKYLVLAKQSQDEFYHERIKSLAEFQTLSFNEQLRLQELEKESALNRNRIRTLIFSGGTGMLLILSLVLYRNYRQKQKANARLEHQKDEIQNTLSQLRVTQSQLIQSEKMASLGELTAGIAHEIQNPLNFVNNFSEVNTELIDELDSELVKGNWQQAKEIAGNIKENEQKIVFHGKRADAIVKGMLQHSRSSSGVKEPTDINALADEYFRLAYHGLRAKDKTFNATMKTDFDPDIGLVNVVPQDIGRVILNLITNAFYAVSNKGPQPPKEGLPYEPTVVLSTKYNKSPSGELGANNVEIRVRDNGNGIPQKVLDKIFQPFFTTKPTGQGTGLGLSLSYDIIKAHGGDLRVETKEGVGSTFIIILPKNNP